VGRLSSVHDLVGMILSLSFWDFLFPFFVFSSLLVQESTLFFFPPVRHRQDRCLSFLFPSSFLMFNTLDSRDLGKEPFLFFPPFLQNVTLRSSKGYDEDLAFSFLSFSSLPFFSLRRMIIVLFSIFLLLFLQGKDFSFLS